MEQKPEVDSENPSLSILNEDCIRNIFKFLQLKDFLNLAKTCWRLLCVAGQYKKFKNINVVQCDSSPNTEKQFSNVLSVIGEHVVSVNVYPENFELLQIIADNCSNLSSVYLNGKIFTPQATLPFRNLKKLEMNHNVSYSSSDWKTCFANNPGIEVFEYYDWNECMEHLYMLPKLKSLCIYDLRFDPEEMHHLSCLASLTTLFITSDDNCNQLLVELAKKLNLVALFIDIDCDADTFNIFKSFLHLESLSIGQFPIARVPEPTNFPPLLKMLKLDDIDIPCSVFLSIVKQLKLLEEFEMDGRILWYNDACKSFYQAWS